MCATVIEHGSPARGGRRNAEAKKTHGRFGEDGAGHADRGLHDYRLNDIGKNVANDDAQIAGAESARGFNEFAFPRGQNLSANQARVAHPSAERERDHKIEDAGAAECDEGDGNQNSRERKKRIHQDDVDEAVDAASVVSSDRSDDQSERQRCQHDAAADEHGDARAINDARKNVAAEFVGTEPVRVGGGVETRRKIDRGRILRSDPGREHRKDYEHDDQNTPAAASGL